MLAWQLWLLASKLLKEDLLLAYLTPLWRITSLIPPNCRVPEEIYFNEMPISNWEGFKPGHRSGPIKPVWLDRFISKTINSDIVSSLNNMSALLFVTWNLKNSHILKTVIFGHYCSTQLLSLYICCKNCNVCLERPKITKKEDGVCPFKKTNFCHFEVCGEVSLITTKDK